MTERDYEARADAERREYLEGREQGQRVKELEGQVLDLRRARGLSDEDAGLVPRRKLQQVERELEAERKVCLRAREECSRLHAACEAYLHRAERAEARAEAAEKECERLTGQGEFLMHQIATLGVKLDEARARANRLAAVVRWYSSGLWRHSSQPTLEPGDLGDE
jgi:chromosome segregation ATPase